MPMARCACCARPSTIPLVATDLYPLRCFLASRMKMVVEPTGCLAAAAVLQNIVPVTGKRVGVIISGGNVDTARLAQFLA